MINREMNHRYLLVKLDYHDRDPLSVVAEVTKAIAQRVSFDRTKYHIEWGGQFERPAAGGGALQADPRHGAGG